ncbi:MAG: response regulator [Bacteroidota bacterium]
MPNKLLIVDDSESIRELVGYNLEDAGYKVVKAVNGKDGLEKLNEEIKLIVSDLNMPVMDGITMIKNIRKEPKYKHLPIIMLTTESQQGIKNEARKAGATAWIVKPFDRDKLIQVIKRFVR